MLRLALRSTLLATVPLAVLAVPAPAQAQEASAETDGPAIIVTGTRATTRTVENSPVPVDVIGGAALANVAGGETNKALNALVPSFNFPRPTIADGTDALRPATLRGLAPDQTLVLINGKRRHVSALLNINGTVGRGSAAVDLNLIPGLAIDRIEVLRDGASSQYGSDAIAGVINVRLKRASSGGRATVSFGKYITTLSGVANVTGLQTSGGAPVLDAVDSRVLAYNSDGERKARDGEVWTLGSNFGFGIGSEGFINITAEYRDRAPTNRAGYDIRPNYIRPTSTTWDTREVGFDRLQTRWGDAKTQDYNFIVNAGVPVGDFELYAFGTIGQRDGLSAANWRQQNAAANRNFSTITPDTTPSNANFTALTPDGFLPFIDTKLKDYGVTLGLKGQVGGFGLDVSAQTGRNSFDYRVENTLNTSFGPQSQRSFDAGGLRYRQTLVNVDLTREMDMGFAKPLSLAFGGEYRRENFQIRPGELQSYAIGPFFRATINNTTAANCATQQGVFNATTNACTFPGRTAAAGAQGFPGIPANSATNVSRDNVSAYVELDTDLLPGFTTTLAGRFEHYSDFGSTVTGKLATRFEVAPGFALRGSLSNGFRAPSLHQQYFTTTSTNFISGVPVDISTVAVNSPVARALGSKDLKPEKSVNLSLGATASPLSGLSLTIDYYNIKITDRVVLTENLGAAGSGTTAVNNAVRDVLNANGFQSVGAARFFINGLDTRTQGIDAVASWRVG